MFIISAFPMAALAAEAPVATGASVNGTALTITFGTCALDTAATLVPTEFTVAVTPTLTTTVSTATVTNATTVTLGLSVAIPNGSTATVTYTGTDIVCTTGVPANAITALNVTVATPPPPPSDQETQGGGGGALIPVISYTQLREATLPTSNASAFDFVLDPQGLFYLSDDQIKALVVEPTGDLGRLGEMAVTTECNAVNCPEHGTGDGTGTCNEVRTWRLLQSAGQIIFSEHTPFFINNSNFEMALELTLSFAATGTGPVVTTIADPTTVATGTAAQVFIGASFSDVNVNASPTDFSLGSTLPVLTTAQKPLFLLDAANYTDNTTIDRDGDDIITAIAVNQKAVKVAGANGHGTQFRLAGRCNPNADWEAALADRTLGINVVFDLTSPAEGWEFTDEEKGVGEMEIGAAITTAYGLYTANDLTGADFIDWTPPAVGPPPVVGDLFTLLENGVAITSIAAPTTHRQLTVDGLPVGAAITGVSIVQSSGTFNLTMGPGATTTNHFNWINDILHFHPNRNWPLLSVDNVLTLSYRVGSGSVETTTITTITLG
jgi:hypothetical protein